MDSDDLMDLAWVFLAMFLFTLLDFDVVAKQVQRRFFSNTGGGGNSGGGNTGGGNTGGGGGGDPIFI